MYTHCATSEFVINRFVGATSSESFDCYSIKDGTKFMVNVKAEKVGQQNNALAEIGQLHSNSIFEVSAKEISFDSSQTSNFKNSEESDAIICFLLKLFYSARNSYFDSESGVYHPNHIYLENVEISCLTESQH